MATQIIFKSACPSCEALIPIRDESMVGKKVECPKCKYRFVVEEPEGFSEPADGVEEAAPKKKPKKKAKSNTPMLIGAGVGTVAIAVLAVVGYFVFAGDKDAAKPTVKPQPVAVNNNNTKDPSTPDNTTTPATTQTPGDANPADAPAVNNVVVDNVPAGGASGDISNMLPNDSKIVCLINLEKEFRYCTMGEQMWESKVGFRPGAFKEKIGIGHDEMKQLVRGEHPEQKWSFNVLRTIKAVNIKDLQKVLGFTKAKGSPIMGREFYELPKNDLLDNIAAALKPESELRARKDKSAGPLGLVQLDQTTLVFASMDPLQEFLKQNAKPRMLSKPTKPIEGDGNNPPAGGAAPEGPRRGGRSMGVNYATTEFLQNPPGGEPQLTDNATFLTIEPALKAMMDHLNPEPRNVDKMPIFVGAAEVQADPSVPRLMRNLTGFPIPDHGLRVFGVVLNKYDLEKFYTTLSIEFFNENDVKEVESQLKKQLNVLARILGLYLGGIKVETEGADGGATDPNAGGGGPMAPGAGGGGNTAPSGGGLFPGLGPTDDGPVSKLKLKRKNRYLSIEGEMNTPQRAHDRINRMTEGVVAKMRGLVDMASPTPLWKEFAGANMKLLESGTVPRATYQRSETTGGRLVRNWPPSQRVSWMVGLLPHLAGHDDLYKQVDREKSWRDDRNLKAGSLVVPPFLDPRFPEATWYANLESLGSRAQGATHYVGMAGVGLEAGDYKLDDPAVAKKIGAFGYDRTLSTKDVTDGLANTIMVIEVAPNYQRPWIAGGGATMMGAPETKSIKPFVGKRFKGTYVVMLDGSVRFISEDISDEVFKSLCTIKGGETIDDLEKVAPKAKPGGPQMKTDTKDDDKDKEDKEKEDKEAEKDRP